MLYGEIEDDVAGVGDIEDLLSINEVRFKVLSVDRTLAKSDELQGTDRQAADQSQAPGATTPC